MAFLNRSKVCTIAAFILFCTSLALLRDKATKDSFPTSNLERNTAVSSLRTDSISNSNNLYQRHQNNHNLHQGMSHTDGSPEGRHMQILQAPKPIEESTTQRLVNSFLLPKKSWNVPHSPDPVCPSFCGDRLEFEPFAQSSKTGRILERGKGTKTFFRMARPDLLDRVHAAVEEIDRAGELDTDFACRVFDACDEIKAAAAATTTTKQMNRHSRAYLVCDEYDWIRASKILRGVARRKLPGFLRQQGDANVLCEIAHYVSDLVTEVILPSVGLHNKHCIVQEQFVNQQRAGAKTNMHFHEDDSYGGLFYLDVPESTRLCFSNAEGSSEKKSWWDKAPQLTENLFPQAGEQGNNYRGYVEPRAGDLVLFPVGWAQHWVPKMEMEPHEKRTSVVFNMICT